MKQASSESSHTGPRILGLCRIAWGTALLVIPKQIMNKFGAPASLEGMAAVVVPRLLGGRHILQGIAEVSVGPRWQRMGSLVDSLHWATDVAVGLVDDSWRRAALGDSLITGSFAVAGWKMRAPRP